MQWSLSVTEQGVTGRGGESGTDSLPCLSPGQLCLFRPVNDFIYLRLYCVECKQSAAQVDEDVGLCCVR